MNTVLPQHMKAFLKGFASTFDLSGRHLVELHGIPGGFERDGMMLRGDWDRIGNDMRKAMDTVAYEKQQEQREQP